MHIIIVKMKIWLVWCFACVALVYSAPSFAKRNTNQQEDSAWKNGNQKYSRESIESLFRRHNSNNEWNEDTSRLGYIRAPATTAPSNLLINNSEPKSGRNNFTPIILPGDFRQFDGNGDGYIDLQELISATGAKENSDLALKAADTNKDGKVSETEFHRAPWMTEERNDSRDIESDETGEFKNDDDIEENDDGREEMDYD